jgi:hypothetical protein
MIVTVVHVPVMGKVMHSVGQMGKASSIITPLHEIDLPFMLIFK